LLGSILVEAVEGNQRKTVAVELTEHDSAEGIPPAARLLRELANTVDLDDGTDVLTTCTELTEFLHGESLLVRRTRASDDELALARRLRSGLREAFALNHADVRRSVPDLDAVLAELPIRLHWGLGSPALVATSSGVSGALTQFAIAVTETLTDGSWSRLKICPDEDCAVAYYDASKNRSKNWCGVSCGNRAKTRAYRARQKSAGG